MCRMCDCAARSSHCTLAAARAAPCATSALASSRLFVFLISEHSFMTRLLRFLWERRRSSCDAASPGRGPLSCLSRRVFDCSRSRADAPPFVVWCGVASPAARLLWPTRPPGAVTLFCVCVWV